MRGLRRGGTILCVLAGAALLGGCAEDEPDPPSAKSSSVSSENPSASLPAPHSTESPNPTTSLRSSVPSLPPVSQTPDDGVTRTQRGTEDPFPASPGERKRKAVGWAGVFGGGNHDPEGAAPWYMALAEKDCASVVAERDDRKETKELIRGIRAVCPVSDPDGRPDWAVAEEVAASVEAPDAESCDESVGFDLLRTLVEVHKKDPEVVFRVVDDGPGAGSCKEGE